MKSVIESYEERNVGKHSTLVVFLIVGHLAIPAKPVPSLKGVAACFGQGALRRADGSVFLEHEPDEAEYGHSLLQPLAAHLVMVGLGGFEVGLKLVECDYVSEDLAGLRCRVLYLLQFAVCVRHAVEGRDAIHL